MAELNVSHFIKSENPDELYNFVAAAVFAFDKIKAGNIELAKNNYGSAFEFAYDNKDMTVSEFAIEAGKLVPSIIE